MQINPEQMLGSLQQQTRTQTNWENTEEKKLGKS